MDEHELAWAAGFFDGDGWAAQVRFGRGSRLRPMARINQGSLEGMPEVLIRFREAVGLGRLAGPKIEEGRQPLYWWVASSRSDVTRTGEVIGPWLSHEKRDQFSVAVGLNSNARPIDCLASAAGLFDAEGSTSLSDHRSHPGHKAIEAAVTQGSAIGPPEELVRFCRLLGLGKVYGPYLQKGASGPIYRWRAHGADNVRLATHLLQPWLGDVKRRQAQRALAVIDAQPVLQRGRPDWGSHKTHCIHGHEYLTARLRPYVARGSPTPPRENHRCLTCLRELARRKRAAGNKIGGLPAADPDRDDDGTTC